MEKKKGGGGTYTTSVGQSSSVLLPLVFTVWCILRHKHFHHCLRQTVPCYVLSLTVKLNRMCPLLAFSLYSSQTVSLNRHFEFAFAYRMTY